MQRTFFALVGLVLLVGACGDDAPPTTATIVVEGYAHAGPVCPVMQDPPDPGCADRPVEGAAMQVVDADGDVVVTVTTTGEGTFSTLLPPGTYTLIPQPVEGLLGTAATQTFTVGSAPVSLDVAYDTGIR